MLFELGWMAVFKLQVSDKLFVAAVVDTLPVAVVDRLEVNILAVASSTDKSVDMVLGWIGNLELGTGNQDFDIDFPIIGYLFLIYSQSLNAFVYHSSGKHTSSAATADWSKIMGMTDSRNNLHFLDYCIIVEKHMPLALQCIIVAVEMAVVVVGVVEVAAVKSVQ
ncbi:hypothetical protein G9A89_008012 [Geosiphon pyriformis]|nr:hypothetical protein G9A89_008012 [Geosiphon pyriformis]